MAEPVVVGTSEAKAERRPYLNAYHVFNADQVDGLPETFTREREINTFEALMLSLLSPREIIAGKLCAPLLACRPAAHTRCGAPQDECRFDPTMDR